MRCGGNADARATFDHKLTALLHFYLPASAVTAIALVKDGQQRRIADADGKDEHTYTSRCVSGGKSASWAAFVA
jgi:hypothetical protein